MQLFEEYPARYPTDMSRRHRWIRGDWQIGLAAAPSRPRWAASARNPLSTLSRWKIFDNLRRSLVPAALTGLRPLVLGPALARAEDDWPS